jgi:hypothetical protein
MLIKYLNRIITVCIIKYFFVFFVEFYGAPTLFKSYGAETGNMIFTNLGCYNVQSNTRGVWGQKLPHLLELLKSDALSPVIETNV